MQIYGYQDIIEYFETLAIASPIFEHTINGKVSFIASDTADLAAIENTPKLRSPYMIAGYSPAGLDQGRGMFQFSPLDNPIRTYSINIAIFKEVDNIDSQSATKATQISLDIISDEVLTKIYQDWTLAMREEGTADCCFFRHLDTVVPIYKTPPVGTRKALGIILSLTFNFKRESL